MPALPPYEEVTHTADWALRVRGANLGELFLNAAQGMYALLAPEPGPDAPALGADIASRRVMLTAPDAESLLVAWLNELLYLTESEALVFDRFRLTALSERYLEAVVEGVPARALKKQIKAATFHDLRIQVGEDGFQTTIVFDV